MAIETRMHVETEVVSVPFSGFVLFSFYKGSTHVTARGA